VPGDHRESEPEPDVNAAGDLTVKLAKEFGFCYGVERAIDLAYAARKFFPPDKPIYLLGEIIHNPEVNDQIRNMGIQIISPKPTEAAEKPDLPSTSEMMQRTLEAMRLEAQIAKDMDAYQKRPKRRFIGARAAEYRFARYVEDWRLKVERIGNLNYPEAARSRKLYGSLLLTVSIRADGSVETVEVNRSSGHRILDAAAVKIVEMAAPYAAFPSDIRRDTDILHITRTWSFTKGDELVSQ